MISFKQFVMLLEGGNVVGKVHRIQAAPFSNEYRSRLQDDVRETLTALHNYVHTQSGGQIHLFGPNAAALHLHADQAPFTGSSKHFMNRAMSDQQYNLLKPEGMTGDIDVQYMPHPEVRGILVPERRKKTVKGVVHKWFEGGIPTGTKLGPFEVADMTSAGDTEHFVLRHKDFSHLKVQLDLEQSAHSWEPNEHGILIPGNRNTDPVSSNENDMMHPEGPFKGVHHKHIIALAAKVHPENLKYAMKGLKPKEAAGHEVGMTTHEDVGEKLFGVNDREVMSSFTGVVDLIKKHYTPEQRQAILSEAEGKQYGFPEHVKAYLHKHLSLLTTASPKRVTEQVEQEHHVATTVLTGVDPFTHEGHIRDIGQLLHSLPGEHKFFAMSAKSAFPHEERKKIFARQAASAGISVEPFIANENDDVINNAWDAVKDKPGKKHLHLVAGEDREGMVNRIVDGLTDGRIANPGFDVIHDAHIHKQKTSDKNKGQKRAHDFSGTNLRRSAEQGDLDTFHEHLGPAFSKQEAEQHMKTVQALLALGVMKVKRK